MTRATFISACIFGLLALTSTAAAAGVWYVDDNAPNDPGPFDNSISDPLEDGSATHPFDEIQEALDAASAGDSVLVLGGTYWENVNFNGVDLTLMSVSGPAVTTINGNALGPCVTFNSGETRAALLEGFTLTNGLGEPIASARIGGGVRCLLSSPTIRGNVFSGNLASYGGGMDTERGNPLIERNVFQNNEAEDSHLGPLHLTGDGGGISVFDSSAEIYNNVVIDNVANRNGGGVHVDGTDPFHAVDVFMRNNLIAGNHAQTGFGGGVAIRARAFVEISGCTIADNIAFKKGAGMNVDGADTDVLVTNSIFWDNVAVFVDDEINSEAEGLVEITYCDVHGGEEQVTTDTLGVAIYGPGNVDVDPPFVNAAGGDYHLSNCSPLIDAGDPAYAGTGETDMDGQARKLGSAVEIGFDEFIDNVRADVNCDGSVNGFDIDPFVGLLTGSGSPCFPCAGDMNDDGSVNGFDIDGFVAALTG
ncbi:MAG: hypothetical protein CHACPFDD_01210 [Phycisphaerae bacterium]|nr:hypothetical protein [Phycisphaerae bacterium]